MSTIQHLHFAAAGRLWLLLVPAALVIAYVAMQVRRRFVARRFAADALLPLVAPNRPGRWRHAIAALFVVVLVLGTLGAAKPTVPGTEEREEATIMVAIDVSDSMGATDVAPNRITAATAAAKAFIDDLPDTFEVGLVTAGSTPTVVVSPTTDRAALASALDGLQLSPGTALGEAIFTALSAIPSAPAGAGTATGTGTTAGDAPAARIVLLSDGVTTTGRSDQEAAAAAVEAGVPISTIAFGTANASVVSQGITVDVGVDRTSLQAIADATGGTLLTAANASELAASYAEIDAQLQTEPVDRDVADWFAGAALVLLMAAVVASMTSTSRVAWA